MVPAPGAGPLLRRLGHGPGRSFARAGRSAFRSITLSLPPPLAARRRAGTFSARVAISCAGVTPKMSHSAASTGSDSRSGVWVTSRHTCTDDSVIPRSASSGSAAQAALAAAANGTTISGQDPLELLLIELMRAAGLVRRIATNINQAAAKLNTAGQPTGDLPRYAADSLRRADNIDAVADAVRKALR